MRVTRLEIFGFKSFVERFVLSFDKNVIGIVGPNGCGKSNIVDALRWVLGETQAKQLRGSLFDDLIFNGSDSRRPLGMAEVSLTIRPELDLGRAFLQAKENGGESGNSLGSDESEIATAELLHAVDDVEVATSAALPEVEAQSSAPTLNSLADIPGLFDASEIQLSRRLYRSGESEYFINRVPCRLRDMIELYRLIGLGARGLSIVAQGQIGQFVSRKPVERRELLEEAAGIAGIRTRIETAQRKLERARENIARLVDIVSEVDKQVKVLRRQAKRAQDRQELKDQLLAADTQLYKAKVSRIHWKRSSSMNELAGLRQEITACESEVHTAQVRQEEFGAKLDAADVELVSVRSEYEQLQKTIRAQFAREQEIRVEHANVEARLRSVSDNLSRIDQRKQSIGVDIERRRQNIASLKDDAASRQVALTNAQENLSRVIRETSSEAINGEGAALDDGERELARLRAAVERLPEVSRTIAERESQRKDVKRALWEQRERLNAKNLELGKLQSEIRTCERQLEALSAHGMQALPESALLNASAVLQQLDVPAASQRAIEAILAEKLQFVSSASSAGDAGKLIASGEAGRKRLGLVVQGLTECDWEISSEERKVAPSAVRLVDLVHATPELYGALSRLLEQVVFVETTEECLALGELYQTTASLQRHIAVSSSGALGASWGWCTTTGEGALLKLAPQIAEGKARSEALVREIGEVEQEIAAIEREVFALDEKLKDSSAERNEIFQSQKQITQLVEATNATQQHLRQEALKKERLAQEAVRKETAELAQTQGRLDAEVRRSEEMRRELDGLDAEREYLIGSQSAVETELRDVAARLQALQSEFQNQTIVSGEGLSIEALEERLKALEKERTALKVLQSEESHRVDIGRRALSERKTRETEILVALEGEKVELDLLEQDIRSRYGSDATVVTSEEKESFGNRIETLDLEIEDLQAEVSRYRTRLEREGEVDPQSIELFEQEDSRLQILRRQYEDLDSATRTLETTIRRLKDISRKRFVSTFDAVNKTFSELIPRLFGGGAGHLELVDPEDPLTSGVELSVRIPGKKVRNMELLSGGEKALVATSVLMAMFLHRPSPICVLDEVDAPLDDANLDRFLELIREISATTQFLIITHNKQSMAAVDRLIGITMQEKGVSTALSVSFEEAEERWAANA